MRILIVGSNRAGAIEKFYAGHLDKYSDVHLFDAQSRFLSYYQSSTWNKLKYRIGFSRILKRINEELLLEVVHSQPDIVFVFKGIEILPKTLVKIKAKGIVLVNYNPDHPLKYFSSGSGNKNILESIGIYDHHFSYSKKIIGELKDKYNVPVSWLPFGYNYLKKNNFKDIKYRLCFIGNPDEERIRLVKLLLANDIPLTLYGKKWVGMFSSQKEYLQIHSGIYDKDFVDAAQSYVIQLNVFRPHNADSHNMRTFEMPALGCLMLAPDSTEHQVLFEENKEAFFYKDDIDLVEKAKKILRFSEAQIKEIQNNAHRRTLNSNYSYEDRAVQVFKTFEQLLDTEC